MKSFFITIFLVLTTVFLLHYYVVGQATYGDGIYYWSLTRSLAIDQDIHLANELTHYYNPENNNSHTPLATEGYDLTPTQKAWSRYPPGASLFWLPFFLFAYKGSSIFNIFGAAIPLHGYGDIFQISVGIGNILFITAALIILYKFLRFFYTQSVVMLTLVTLVFATNLLYYASIDVLNSHPFSFLLSTVFIYSWYISLRKRSFGMWVFLGFLLGLLVTTRTQDMTFVTLLGTETLLKIYDRKNRRAAIKGFFIPILLCGLGFIIGLFPQLTTWQILFGSITTSPYLSSEKSFDFLHPHFIEILINTKTGLLYYSPVLLIALYGFYFFRKRQKIVFYSLLVSFLAQYYLIASWNAWHQGASYGIRMMITSFPLFALGLAQVIMVLKVSLSLKKVVGIAILFIVLNICMILLFLLVVQDPTYDRGKNTQELLWENMKFTAF